jgi:sugar phosphate isomerase/epimerase
MTSFRSTRRGFLGGAAAAAGLAGGGSAGMAAEAAGDLKLGIATYSLREFQRGLAIRMIRRLNVSYASVKDVHLPFFAPREELVSGAREFEQAGITIAGGGVVYMTKDDDNDIRGYFEYARTCGMPLMAIGPTRETLKRIERFVKEYDIKVAIHNHGPEDKHFPTPESALQALDGMDPRMGVCIDVGHTARAGVNVVDAIRAAGPRLLDMHIKDMRNLRDGQSGCPVGDGAMPIVAMFQEMKRMKYAGCVNLEYEVEGDDPLLGMAKSYSYMRGVLAGLKG